MTSDQDPHAFQRRQYALPGSEAYNNAVRADTLNKLEGEVNRPDEVYQAEAEQQQNGVDHFLEVAQSYLEPALEIFTEEMHARCSRPAKHENSDSILENMPKLESDPEGWHNYLKDRARFETWKDESTKRKFSVAGVLGEEGLMLAGMFVEQQGPSYPSYTWAQVAGNGLWVRAAHRRTGDTSSGAIQRRLGLETTTMILETPIPQIQIARYHNKHSTTTQQYEYDNRNGNDKFRVVTKPTDGIQYSAGFQAAQQNIGFNAREYEAMLQRYADAFGARSITQLS